MEIFTIANQSVDDAAITITCGVSGILNDHKKVPPPFFSVVEVFVQSVGPSEDD